MMPWLWMGGGSGSKEAEPAPQAEGDAGKQDLPGAEGGAATGAGYGMMGGESNPTAGESYPAQQSESYDFDPADPPPPNDFGQGQEDVWGGSQDPWKDQGDYGGGGGESSGWGWTDIFGGDD
jgi:hypothetical protein